MPQAKPMKWLNIMLAMNTIMMIMTIKLMFTPFKMKKFASTPSMKMLPMKW